MKILPSIFFASALGEIPFVFTKDEIEKFAKSWNMRVDKSHSTTYEIMGTCQKRKNWSILISWKWLSKARSEATRQNVKILNMTRSFASRF